MRRHTRAALVVTLAAALVVAVTACGGDDSADPPAAADSSGSGSGTSADGSGGDGSGGGGSDTSPDDPNGERALGGDPAGTVVMTVGDTTVEADIVSCTVVAPEVTFVAQGETAAIEVASTGGSAISVSVTGAYEFTGNGTASVSPDDAIDEGEVTITGTGAEPDDAAPVEDFTIQAEITSC